MHTDYLLNSKDELTNLAKSKGINSWNELTQFVKNLPYGRNENRTDFRLVFSEMKGTCSSKHALLKCISDLNDIPDVKLIIGIYRMSESNTPQIGTELSKNGIEFIPEAHCYLKIKGKRIDLTSKKSAFEKIEKDIIEEKEIEPAQIGEFKVDYHIKFLKSWLKETKSKLGFDGLWLIREKCVKNLA